MVGVVASRKAGCLTAGRFETSAALGVGIDDASQCLLEKIFQDTSLLPKKSHTDQPTIALKRKPPPKDDCIC